ncbi:MAG: hypothetical protein CMO80_08050 [Verrucomicrobiales bacterium]|nr:hypothetical protein [Verrucomicrobiales bacterium]|tara:strand:- start:1009 stop:1665 length:657 start_codon:yes stop_codon:yes gene_type:complete
MLRILFIIAIYFAASSDTIAADKAGTNTTDKASYIIGYNLGASLARDGVKLDIKSLIEGFSTGQAKRPPKYSVEEMKEIVSGVRSDVVEVRKNHEIAFLEQNKKNTNVVVTDSGLQYQIIEPGEGTSPKPHEIVTVNYTGHLIDGREFDNSYKRKKATVVAIESMLPGWKEAIVKMKPGSQWRLFIPSELGYGKTGAPPRIPPHATLIFNVELVKVGL